jgi:hypothetical protein
MNLDPHGILVFLFTRSSHPLVPSQITWEPVSVITPFVPFVFAFPYPIIVIVPFALTIVAVSPTPFAAPIPSAVPITFVVPTPYPIGYVF